jgi:thioredoxin reductase (NADPH)
MRPDILIIGGGPAAMTAALYSCRAGKSVLLVEKENFGGQIADSPRVENFPSQKVISGLDFSNALFEQITALGANYEIDEAKSIEPVDDYFKVTGNFGTYEGGSVIIATGVKHRKLGIEGEDRLLGHGVSYCAVCDGPFYEGKDVVVIGDANSALQYAIMLAGYCRKVTVVTLFDKFFADEILAKGLESLKNVEIFHNFSGLSFNGEKELRSVSFENTKTHEKKEFVCDGAFVAIGQVPDNDRFANVADLNKGYLVVDENMATKTPGVYAAGDCRDKKWRQLTTACNDGAIASLSAAQYLFKKAQS